MINPFFIFVHFSYLDKLFYFHNLGSQQLWMKNDITHVNIKPLEIRQRMIYHRKQSCLIDQLATFQRLFNKRKKEED